ncbi:DUF4097 family beta strand repeat-containing protein [Pilimelia columellifera]|uniref:DUF4097 domain-containing protein n=1 Tax=Pilimelia columellifera subsp. columellifera TaxID=706583 RepID=A0ABN3NAU1_9ACTN
MATKKLHTSVHVGALTYDVDLPAGTIAVKVDPDADRTTVRVSTIDDIGQAADMVTGATFTETAGRLTVRLPKPPAVTHVNGGSISVIQNLGIVTGSVTGVVIDRFGNVQAGGGTAIVGAVAPIVVEVTVPPGSGLVAAGQSCDVIAVGQLHTAWVNTMSGNVHLDAVFAPEVKSMSGDIRVGHLTGDGRFSTMSGDIHVNAAAPVNVRASSMSGDVTVTGPAATVHARSMSGRVRTRD